MKKVSMKMPIKKTGADEWVNNRTSDVSEGGGDVVPMPINEPMKRLTLDVTESLHRRIKTECALKGTKMADILREILEREFPAANS